MKVLVLSPHTDDAELGAGGTIARHVNEGHRVHWNVFTDASSSLPDGFDDETLADEFMSSLKELGGGQEVSFSMRDYPVRRLHEHRQEVLEWMVGYRNTWSPDLVIGPSLNDHHQDHQVVAQEMVRAFKGCARILCYELPWNHVRFESQAFAILNEQDIERKIAALQCYESQAGKPYMDPDFVRGLARTRGVQVGVEYAEAFEVVRWRV